MLPRFGFGHEPRRNHAEPAIRGRVPTDVRRLKVVASVALIAILASVAVPGPVGSWVPSPAATVDPDLFRQVEVAALAQGTPMTTTPQDPGARSAGSLAQGSTIIEPDLRTEPLPALVRRRPAGRPGRVDQHEPLASRWRHLVVRPHLYGNGTACGQTLTKALVGVAHRTLPCGTLVTFRYGGRTVTVPVVDRGPYVSGRTWDLTYGACSKLAHCFTGSIDWRLAGS